jgi:predicted TIM-barrel fold metal-dependent hydrolase
MHRRAFLGLAGATALHELGAQMSPIPIIDTHIHLYDTARPQGVPWPNRDNKLIYLPTLPSRFREVTKGLGIRGAIEVECSPWFDDNQWVLDVAQKDTIMVGTIGNLEPGQPEFARHLERFRKNPLFRGIRYGNLWGRDFTADSAKPEFIAGLKLLADAGLVLDTANPNQRLLQDILRVSDRVPTLRIVIDHLPGMDPPPDATTLQEFTKRPQIYVKLSAVLRRRDGQVSDDVNLYRPRLDELSGAFGPDRVLYGSDWPNSEPLGPYPKVLGVVQRYFAGQSREAAEKYFWKNSVAAYRWIPREPAQPRA